MRCQSCSEREATVVITKIVEDQHQVVQLCATCASGFDGPGGVAVTIQTMPGGADSGPTCERCGTSFEDFRTSGLFGCADCYAAFEAELPRLFRRIQGAASHGDEEQGAAQLFELESRLRAAVGREAYEEAAELRDRIHRLRAGSGAPSEP